MAAYLLRPVLIPFVLAVFLVYCLRPVMDLQMRHLRFNRGLALTGTILLSCAILFLVWLLIWASVSDLSANASVYETQFRQLTSDVAAGLPLEKLGVDADEMYSLVQMPQDSIRGLLGQVISSITSVLSNGLLVVIFMIFILAGSAPAPPAPGGLREEIDDRIKRYLLTKVLVSATTGTLVGLTLWLLGVELAMVFGVLAFLLNFIPNIGSVIATLLPLPVVLLSPDLSTTAKLMAFAIPGGVQFAVGNLLEPKIMGQSLDLHPVAVLLGLIFFGMIWGIIGMILATPIVAVLKIVLERLDLTAPVAQVLAGRMQPQPDTAMS